MDSLLQKLFTQQDYKHLLQVIPVFPDTFWKSHVVCGLLTDVRMSEDTWNALLSCTVDLLQKNCEVSLLRRLFKFIISLFQVISELDYHS